MEMKNSNKNSVSMVAYATLLFLAILISMVSAPNQIIINYGNQTTGGGCQFNSQCASNLCVGGLCIPCSSNSECSSNWCDAGVCRACSVDSECSSSTNYCVSGVCAACPNDLACTTGLCVGGSCLSCTINADCAMSSVGALCNITTNSCEPCSSDTQCAVGICSAGQCRTCGQPDNIGCPNNWNCNSTTGKCGCRSMGQACVSGLSCCSGTCRDNICTSCVVDLECPSGYICSPSGSCVIPGAPSQVTGAAVGPSGAAGAVSQTSYATSVSVTQEVERKTAAPFITSIFGLSRLKTSAISTCVRGAPCSSSTDCCGAECIQSACLCSKTACVTSGECCEGYCEGGFCKKPPVTSLFLAEAFRREITPQIGCTGLIDECDPTEKTCISICEGLTGILLLVSAGFGVFTFRLYKNPVPGLFAGFSLIILGLVTYPFVGIVIGVIIFGLLLAK